MLILFNFFLLIFLVSAWGGTSSCYTGGDESTNPLYPTRQQPEVSSSRLLYKGKKLNSVMQLDGNSFRGYVVLDSFNMVYSEENSI